MIGWLNFILVFFAVGFNQIECSFIVLTAEEPSTNPDDIHFLLWTRNNPIVAQELRVDHFGSDFDNRLLRPTLMYAHGWRQNGTNQDVLTMRDEMLRNGDWNFISIDWGELARGHNYHAAKRNVDLVGNVTARLVHFLVVSTMMRRRDIHLVGFSLGAHVVGSVGTSVNITRITGLDPAKHFMSPLVDSHHRLDPSDANFVDVIHTNAGGAGVSQQLGHADFYVNGGSKQPGCADDDDEIEDRIVILNDSHDTLDHISSTVTSSGWRCSHNRAVKYFIESINSARGFLAAQCESWDEFASGHCDSSPRTALMGLPAVHTTTTGHQVAVTGIYYLRTAAQSPFALGGDM